MASHMIPGRPSLLALGRAAAAAAGAAWGSVTGTLSAQTDLQAALDAKANVTALADVGGWTAMEACTYLSATTMTIASDVTLKYAKGNRIKLTQTTTKYFYIVGVSTFTGGVTTLTVLGGSDYTLANAAIATPFFARTESPNGFPDWFNFAPALVGFSVLPATVIARFMIRGRTCRVQMTQATAGTSNSTAFSATLPVTTATSAVAGNAFWMEYGRGYNNSAQLTAPVMGFAFWNSAVWSFNLSPSASAWTNSGGKMIDYIGLTYEY